MAPLSAWPLGPTLGFAFVLGLVIGSFLNVVVHRLPRGESLVHPGSHCTRCQRPVAPWDNVPLLSFLWLRGRCRHCRAPISWRYPALELLTGLLFAGIAWRFGISPMTPVAWAFAASLVAAAAIDFDHRIIPDSISLGGLLLALGAVPLARHAGGMPLVQALALSLAGALLGALPIWSIGFVHARWCALRGRRFEHWPEPDEDYPRPGQLDYWVWFPGIGFGDVKLLALIGAVLGPLGAVEALFASALVGLGVGIGWGVLTRRWAVPFGFGPALAAGALLVLLLPPDSLIRSLARLAP